MSLAILFSRGQAGMQAPQVRIEVNLSNGLPSVSIVGLAEAAVRESRERVRCAIVNSQFEFPNRRITINLAPADLPKEGCQFDLAIALGILIASGQLNSEQIEKFEFLGELGLTGDLQPVRGSLPAALALKGTDRALILPVQNLAEASLVKGIRIFGAKHLLDVTAFLQTNTKLQQADAAFPSPEPEPALFDSIIGQHQAKRALSIAAAGRHNLLMLGPPGTGKSLLANSLTELLPLPSEQEALESATVQSLSHQGFQAANWMKRPFRNPHHSCSSVALSGGGSHPRPGEISLAHHGVLFLDEFPEFNRTALEILREPMETKQIVISRANRQITFPAAFQLVAAMNPCPCGYAGTDQPGCRCSTEQVQRYQQRISGPLLDRIDLHIRVPKMPLRELTAEQKPESQGRQYRQQIRLAYARQLSRAGKPNHFLTPKELLEHCALSSNDQSSFSHYLDKLNISARAYHKVLKVARTIADLEEENRIQLKHLQEALQYRQMDRGISNSR